MSLQNEQHLQDLPVIQSLPKGNKAKTQHIKRFTLMNPSCSSADWTRLVHKSQLISSELSWYAKGIYLNLELRFDFVEKDFPSLARKKVIALCRRLVGDPFLCSLIQFLTHPHCIQHFWDPAPLRAVPCRECRGSAPGLAPVAVPRSPLPQTQPDMSSPPTGILWLSCPQHIPFGTEAAFSHASAQHLAQWPGNYNRS